MPDRLHVPDDHEIVGRVDRAASSAPAARTSGQAMRLAALVRTGDPLRVAAGASQRLARVVAEWRSGAVLELTLIGGRGGRPARLRLETTGPEQPGWRDDVAWALASVARLVPDRGATPGRPGTLAELVRERVVLPMLDGLGDFQDRSGDRSGEAGGEPDPRGGAPWPEAFLDDLREVVELLGELPDVVVRFRLARATGFEVGLLRDVLRETWHSSEPELARYLGTPVRLRVLVGAPAGVPPRLAVLLREWARPLALEPLDGREAEDAWAGGPSSLAGHAVPEGLSRGLLRVPAAGHGPFPGFPTERSPFRLRALDPLPERPGRPVAIGYARSASGRSVRVAQEAMDLVRHLLVEGASGAGKSTFITGLARGLAEIGCGYTILEGHGTTVDAVLASLPDQAARDRTLVVRHGDLDHPVPVNLLSGSAQDFELAVEAFVEMVQVMYDPKQEGIVGPRWRRWFTLVAHSVRALWGDRASITIVVQVASSAERLKQLSARIEHAAPDLSNALRHEYGDLSGKESTDMISWAVSKLGPLVGTAPARAVLGTGVDAVDVAEVIDARRGLLVDLASTTVGVPVSRMLGATWLLKHWLALGARADRSSPHVIIVDEAHLFTFGALPNLLAEGRKFGVGVVLATQTVQALTPQLADALESNAGTFLSFRSGLRNAARASVRLGDWPVGDLVRLPDLHAAAVLSRDGVMTEPFTLRIDPPVRVDPEDPAVAEVERRSRALLSAPYRGMTPPTDREIDSQLQSARRPSRHAGSGLDLEEFIAVRRRAARVVIGDSGTDAPVPASGA